MLFRSSFGAGGCFGRQQPATSGRAEHDDDRGSAEWERSRGLGEPIKGEMAHKPPSATKMKRPCLVSCSLGNCMAPARSIDDDDDDFDAKQFVGFVAEHCRLGEALRLEHYGRHLLFPAKTELDPASGSTAHKQQPAARRGGGKGKVKKGRQREMERGKRAKGERG